MIEARGLCKRYASGDEHIIAVDNVDLTVGTGDRVAITGPSGCGKSTLLHMLGGLEWPDEGAYSFAGVDMVNTSDSARARLRLFSFGFVFQHFHLVPELTVYENVELPLIYAGIDRRQRRQRVMEVLERVDLHRRTKEYPGNLSGGQQQRVAIARAIAGRPRLILADEPTGNLDKKAAEVVTELLLECVQSTGASLILVTHNPELAGIMDRNIELEHGRVVADSIM